MSPTPRLEWRCTHRGAARERHLEALSAVRDRLGGGAAPPGPAPLVVVQCGEGPPRALPEAPLGCEVVRVQVDDPAARDCAAALVAGALRFAERSSDLRGPRRGPLAALGRPPVEVDARLCPGSAWCGVCLDACPAAALRRGPDGRPTGRAGACTFCGECVARCPTGALGFSHAPWPALNARLEALVATAPPPLGLVLVERPGPVPCDEPRETAQPDVRGVLALELPPGALGAGVVLRALELGAAAVCAVVARDGGPSGAGVWAASAVARALGLGDRVAIATSLEAAAERLRRDLRPREAPAGRAARDPAQRPDAAAIARSLWRAAPAAAPLRLAGPGAPGGRPTLDEDACSLCGLCAAACPTRALTFRTGATVALEHDPALCPSPCGRCSAACPAGALAVSPELRLPPERVLLVERAGTCPSCGAVWPEAACLAALRARLAGAQRPGLARFISMCPRCRSDALVGSLVGADPPAGEPGRAVTSRAAAGGAAGRG